MLVDSMASRYVVVRSRRARRGESAEKRCPTVTTCQRWTAGIRKRTFVYSRRKVQGVNSTPEMSMQSNFCEGGRVDMECMVWTTTLGLPMEITLRSFFLTTWPRHLKISAPSWRSRGAKASYRCFREVLGPKSRGEGWTTGNRYCLTERLMGKALYRGRQFETETRKAGGPTKVAPGIAVATTMATPSVWAAVIPRV